MKNLLLFVIEKAPDEMPARRAILYREMATVVPTESDARTLLALAADCESLDQQCRQLRLDFDGDKPAKDQPTPPKHPEAN